MEIKWLNPDAKFDRLVLAGDIGGTNTNLGLVGYKDGKFTNDCTMDEMIEFCAQFVDEVNKNMPKPMTKEEYKDMMRQYFPMLKRWKK